MSLKQILQISSNQNSPEIKVLSPQHTQVNKEIRSTWVPTWKWQWIATATNKHNCHHQWLRSAIPTALWGLRCSFPHHLYASWEGNSYPLWALICLLLTCAICLTEVTVLGGKPSAQVITIHPTCGMVTDGDDEMAESVHDVTSKVNEPDLLPFVERRKGRQWREKDQCVAGQEQRWGRHPPKHCTKQRMNIFFYIFLKLCIISVCDNEWKKIWSVKTPKY